MVDTLLFLMPTFLTQILAGVLLLWLFVRSQDEIGLERILLTSVLYCVLNIVIEWFLQDYLLAATLVLQWALFVLLANRICAIRLPRACITLFCYFSLLMGGSMLEARFVPKERSEEEKLLMEGFEESEDAADHGEHELSWARRLKEDSIASKTYAFKQRVVDLLYHPDEEAMAPPPPLPTPTPQPLAQIQAQETPPPPPPNEIESEAPSAPQENSEEPPPVVQAPTPTPTVEPVADVVYPEEDPPRVSNNNSISGEQMNDIVEIKNRSTDPSYDAPSYKISAISMGSGGRYAIVDGDMLREGSIIHTQLETPRGWLLYRIEPNQIFWRPLK